MFAAREQLYGQNLSVLIALWPPGSQLLHHFLDFPSSGALSRFSTRSESFRSFRSSRFARCSRLRLLRPSLQLTVLPRIWSRQADTRSLVVVLTSELLHRRAEGSSRISEFRGGRGWRTWQVIRDRTHS